MCFWSPKTKLSSQATYVRGNQLGNGTLTNGFLRWTQKRAKIDSFPPSGSTSTFEINPLVLTMLQQEKMSNCLKMCDITSNKIKNNVQQVLHLSITSTQFSKN